MLKILVLTSVCFAITGCAATAVTKNASKVMLYSSSQFSLLEKCKKLGPITGSGSGWKPRWSDDGWAGVAEDAKNDLRENAAKKYGADSVALIGLDKQSSSVVAQGIAYKCY